MSMTDRPADHTKRSVKTIKTRENGDGIGEIRCHLCWRKWAIGVTFKRLLAWPLT